MHRFKMTYLMIWGLALTGFSSARFASLSAGLLSSYSMLWIIFI